MLENTSGRLAGKCLLLGPVVLTRAEDVLAHRLRSFEDAQSIAAKYCTFQVVL